MVARAVQGNLALSRRAVASPRLVLLLSFGGTSIINYVTGLVTARLLLPGDFGLLAFVQTILLIIAVALSSGITWSLTAAIVGVAGPRRAALIRGALAANSALAILLGLAVVALFALGPLRPGLETVGVTAVVALTLPFISLVATSTASMQGAERFGVVAAVAAIETVCKAGAGIALVVLGFGATGAIAGVLIGAAAGALFGLYHVVRTLGVRPWGAVIWPSLRATGPMFGALLGLALLQNLDLASVKLFSGGERALTGYYQAATILANTPYYLVSSVLVPVLLPQLARLHTVPATRDAIGAVLRLVVILVIPTEVVLMLAPHIALGLLFPTKYAPAAPTLRVLALGNSALITMGLLATAFQAIGQARVPARVLLTISAVELLVLRAGVPVWHTGGAASTFAAAATLALAALGLVYLRALGRHWMWRVALWLARYLAAVAVGAVIGVALFIASGNGVLAIGLGGLGYLAAVLPLRLVDGSGLPLPRARGSNQEEPIDCAVRPSDAGQATANSAGDAPRHRQAGP